MPRVCVAPGLSKGRPTEERLAAVQASTQLVGGSRTLAGGSQLVRGWRGELCAWYATFNRQQQRAVGAGTGAAGEGDRKCLRRAIGERLVP